MPLSSLDKLSTPGSKGRRDSVPVRIIRDDPHADDALASGWDGSYSLAPPSSKLSLPPPPSAALRSSQQQETPSLLSRSLDGDRSQRAKQPQRLKEHPMKMFKAEVLECLRRDAELQGSVVEERRHLERRRREEEEEAAERERDASSAKTAAAAQVTKASTPGKILAKEAAKGALGNNSRPRGR